MTVNFSLLALDQIVNNAATLLHMSTAHSARSAEQATEHPRSTEALRAKLDEPPTYALKRELVQRFVERTTVRAAWIKARMHS
jgi:hypothetical protein